VDVRIVARCRHYKMVKPPHVLEVARALQAALDDVVECGESTPL
jgi:hypothetical protein